MVRRKHLWVKEERKKGKKEKNGSYDGESWTVSANASGAHSRLLLSGPLW